MKKLISLVLVLTMLCSFASCSLFSDKKVVTFDKTHSVSDPEGLEYAQRVVLSNTKFGDLIVEQANAAAYPDTMVYDDDGNMIGMYDYDETTGIAKGWTSLTDGKYTEFKKGEEKDLGKPDESKMISIDSEVVMGCAVYGSETTATDAYIYIFLSDASVKDTVKELTKTYYGLEFEDESDTVLKCHQDSEFIAGEFETAIEQGFTVMEKDAEAYGEILNSYYMVKKYLGENAYKAYADIKDPEDVDFDNRVVLAGAGEYAVAEDYAEHVSVMTDVLYGKEGKMTAHVTYYESPSKESADVIEEYLVGLDYAEVSRVSDTVVCTVLKGQAMQDEITAYIGYNVLKDDSVEDYTRMIEETFFAYVCE